VTVALLRECLVVDQRGVTITEIMIAIAIMSVGLAALFSAIPIAAYGIQEGNQLSIATFLANQRLEQVRNVTWSAASGLSVACDNLGISASSTAAPTTSSSGAACTTATTTFPDESPMTAPYANYSRTVRITDCSVAPGCSGVVDAGLRQVTVTVSYRPMTGVGVAPSTTTKSAVVTMYVAER
jgi:prepilin-type N-terminal cleavage/methylation domain-containing protein